jgi:hypothetical protein
MNYDIQKATFTQTGNTVTVSLFFNTAAVTGGTLGSFSDAGLNLMVGDLFFYKPDTVNDPSDPGSNVQYAVPLESHNSLTPGALYQVGATETALQALTNANPGDPAVTGDYYRPGETVLMTSGTLVSAGNGVTVTATGDNGTLSGPNPGAMYDVTISFQEPAGFTNLQNSDGQIGILFAAADCANDVIFGVVQATPEPQSLVLIAVGLGMLAGVGLWRRRMMRKTRAA